MIEDKRSVSHPNHWFFMHIRAKIIMFSSKSILFLWIWTKNSLLLKMPPEIHSFVKDPDDFHSVFNYDIKNPVLITVVTK